MLPCALVAASTVLAVCAGGCGDHGNDDTSSFPSETFVSTPRGPSPTPTAPGARFFGAAASIVRSEDNGATWQTLSVGATGIDFIDRDIGGAVGGQRLLRTMDAGETWIDQTGNVEMRDRVGDLVDVAFLTTDDVVAVGDYRSDAGFEGAALILVTHDAGRHWAFAAIDGRNPAIGRSRLRFACFTAGAIGFTCGQGRTSAVCLRSTDRGDSWIDISDRITANFGTCAGTSDLWGLLGSSIVHSSDGGDTWADVSGSLPESVRSPTTHFIAAEFVTSMLGWVAGSTETGPVILRTDDGGASWTQQNLAAGRERHIVAVAFADPLHGIAFGNHSTRPGVGPHVAFATQDGGVSWREITLPPLSLGIFDAAVGH